MGTKKIDIKSGRLLPWQFQLLGVVLLVAAIVIFQQHPFVSIALLIVSLLIFTGYSGIEFKTEEKTSRPYHSFLFLKKGKSIPYDGVEMIYFNANKVSQKVYSAHTTHSNTFKNIEFDAYILFNNGSKEYLLTARNKSTLTRKLEKLASEMNVEIVDNSQ